MYLRRVPSSQNQHSFNMIKFQTFSVLAGTAACNARCDFCVSKMTPAQGVEEKRSDINYDNLQTACRLAERCGVTTALITGKGEPTLFPEDVSTYARELSSYFPLIELQTNAMNFLRKKDKYKDYLKIWKLNGLTTIIISVVHYKDERNREVYCDSRSPVMGGEKDRFDYPPLEETIKYLHEFGYSVRLGVVGCDGYIDSPSELQSMIEFCKDNKVEQLTWRPVTIPEDNIQDKQVADATRKMSISVEQHQKIDTWVKLNGTEVMHLAHGAKVYDVQGQNLCLSSCLTHRGDQEEQRQLIYFTDAKIRYSWVYPGAIIL